MASITDFIGNFKGGNKANRFQFDGAIGAGKGDDEIPNQNQFLGNRFHVRSASLPASTFGAIPVNFRGRTVLYPGERVYAPWTITVLASYSSWLIYKTSLIGIPKILVHTPLVFLSAMIASYSDCLHTNTAPFVLLSAS